MELYYNGSGSISTLKNGNKQSSTSRRDNALRIWVAGRSTLLDSTIGLQSCSGFMGLIRAARPRQQTIADSTSRNGLCGLMERFVGYVVWVMRRLMAGRFKGLSEQGWMSPSKSN